MIRSYMAHLPKPILLLSLILIMSSATASAELVVVVGNRNSVDSLTAGQVKALFLKKHLRYPNGEIATPVNQNEDTRAYAEFSRKALGKDPSQLKSYWSTRVFSGKGTPPDTVGGDAAVKALVSHSPSVIGYIDSSQVDNSVKVVFTFK